MIWGGVFPYSGKLKLQFVCSRQKAADYLKMLNDSSLAQEGHRLREEEWIFQQDNSTTHNGTTTKKYLFEQKIRLIDHSPCSQSSRKLVGIDCCKVYEGGRLYSAISELKNAILDAWEKIPPVQYQKIVDGMPGRIIEVIKSNGRST